MKRSHIGFGFTIVLAVSLAGCGSTERAGGYAALFPKPEDVGAVNGLADITEHREEGLYDFLDGGAELYFDYDIAAAASGQYTTTSGSEIEVSIYDMESPAGAFGIYSSFRYTGADIVEVGNQGFVTTSTLDFWKGPYYCRLVSFDVSEDAHAILLELGRALAAKIAAEAEAPDGTSPLLRLLPEPGRVPDSEKYFRRQLGLNNIRFLSPGNVLHLGDDTEGVVARYGSDQTGFSGFIVMYGGVNAAAAAFASYLEHLSQQAELISADGLTEAIEDDGTITFVALEADYLIGVWDAGHPDARDFIKNVVDSVARWHY
jgi:hypothetical protein